MSSKNPFQQQLQSALSHPEPSPHFQERLEGCITQEEPGLGAELTQGEKEALQKGKLLAGWIWSALLLFLGSVGYGILKLLLPGKQKTKRPGRKMAWNGIRGKSNFPKF
jgi:hypothetical protein